MHRIVSAVTAVVAVLTGAISPAFAKGPSAAQLEVLAGMPGYYTLATPTHVRAHLKGVTLGAASVKKGYGDDVITPLMRAAEETPYPEVIDILIAAGSDINAVSLPGSGRGSAAAPSGMTALNFAVKNPDPAILAALLAHKPDLNLLENADNAPSALTEAANTKGRERHFFLLLEAGAKPSHSEMQDGFYHSGIWEFLRLGKTSNDDGYEISAPRTAPAIAAAQTEALLSVIPAPGCDTFRTALAAGQSEAALLFVRAGVDPGCQGNGQVNNLYYALSRRDREHAIPDPSPELLALLLKHNDVNEGAVEPTDWETKRHGSVFDTSAFSLACKGGMDVALVRMIHEAGARINTDYNGPMVDALKAWRDNPELIAYLLELGFSPTRPHQSSGTRPMEAAQASPFKVLSAPLLVRAGAEPPEWQTGSLLSRNEPLVQSGIYSAEGVLLIQPGHNRRDAAFYTANAEKIMAEARANPEVALYSEAFYRVASPQQVREIIGGRSLKAIRTRSGSYKLSPGPGPAAGVGMVYAYLTGQLVQTWREQDTPFTHSVAVTPHPEVINVLAAAGCDVRSLHSEALALAVRNPNPRVLERVLAYKPDLGAPMYDKATPLHYLAWTNSATDEHLQLLLATKPNLNALDDEGKTPLMRAIWWKRADRARTLMRAGADINAAAENGPTALQIALEVGLYDIARELVAAGAKDKVSRGRRSALSAAVRRKNCDPELIRDLLALSGPHSAEAAEAIKDAVLAHNLSAYILLRDKGVPLQNMPWALANLINSTKHEADALPVVVQLLADGVDPNGKDRNSKSYLWCGIERLLPDICEALIKGGADVNARIFEGNTLLLRAVDVDEEGETRRAAVVRVLIAGGADVRAENEKGWNAMLLGMNKPAVLEQLLAAGLSVNERARCGWTPLGYAASNHAYTDAISALMAAGADPTQKIKGGRTPEQIARKGKNGKALALLEQGRNGK